MNKEILGNKFCYNNILLLLTGILLLKSNDLFRQQGLPLRHILHPLTKQGLNKNVRPLFIWATEPLEVLEHKTRESYFICIFLFVKTNTMGF